MGPLPGGCVSLWEGREDKKKDGGETVCWCVITLHPSDHLKVTLVHWEGLVGSRDPDA